MKYFSVFVLILFSLGTHAQNMEVHASNGDSYVGKIRPGNDDSSTCIDMRHKTICLKNSDISEINKYKPYTRRLPLSALTHPMVYSVDVGAVLRTGILGTGMYASMSMQRRVNDHWSFGVRGHISVGDFLDLGAQGIASYELNATQKRVHSIALMGGVFKDLVYWSEDGFDAMLEWSLLMRKERFRSNRLNIGVGVSSAKFIWCQGPMPCEEKLQRATSTQLRISYGWQF